LSFAPARIPIVSNVTGELAPAALFCEPSYWVKHVREPVRFYPGLQALSALGADSYLELGPQGVLSALSKEAFSETLAAPAVWSSLRKERDEAETWLTALGGLHARGQRVDWRSVLEPYAGRRVPLPTYPFERQRYWLDSALATQAGDATALGLVSAEHPILGASLQLADGAGTIFTGRVSLSSQSWLADHVVLGATIVPGTLFVELALNAAHHLGCDSLEELTLATPLALPESTAVSIQLCVGAADEAGARTLQFHSRRDDAGADAAWTHHASGIITARSSDAQPALDELRDWPPAGATPLPLDGFYEELSSAGVAFGETFRGLRRAYRRDAELFAEVSLAPSASPDAAGYGLHPALFDAALHALWLQGAGSELALPFTWQGVRLYQRGASELRVRLTLAERDRVAVLLADGEGTLLGEVDALRVRRVSADQMLAASDVAQDLYRVGWVPAQLVGESLDATWALLGAADPACLPPAPLSYPDLGALCAALDAGAALPAVVVLPYVSEHAPDADVVAEAHAATHAVLAVLQAWLADARFASSQLLIVTRGAWAVAELDRVPNLAHAPLWGLTRAAQSEHPDAGLRLLDLAAHAELVTPAIWREVLVSEEPQLALRASVLHVPRLARCEVSRPSEASAWDLTQGTVLITGATGTLAGLVAEHLVSQHAAKHLLLCSRAAEVPMQLQARLVAQGATVTFARCDVSQRAQVAALLAGIPIEHPLTAVFHLAAVVDDGVLHSQNSERFDRVFAPKLDGAFHLHDLTRDRPLVAFVMFSSVAGVLGGPGLSNYAAANTFLDALAQHRRARGMVASSLCWGHWAERSGLTASLGQIDLARMARGGLLPMSSRDALKLFDSALQAPDAQLIASRFDPALFAAPAAQLPVLLRGLARRRSPRRTALSTASGSSLKSRLLAEDTAARTRLLIDTVNTAIATVMGVPPSGIAADRPLSELGLDSLIAVELRNQLAAVSGLRLPATLLFDYPTPSALREYLETLLLGGAASAPMSTSARAATAEPIAIVGMGCRYPGGANSPEELWQLLTSGRDVVSDFPIGRGWDAAELYDPDPDARGKTIVTQGGFLHDAPLFDAAFFGMTPREALATDPQQRLLLETSWEALECAGIQPAALQGSATGVFIGIMYNDYAARFTLASAGALEGQLGVGSAPSVASGRVSYTLGLRGPALTLDTACSSSLVTLHLARQALQQGECDLALAGGATVMATPGTFVEFSRQRGLAQDGRCKSFADAADGVGWSEGVGMLVLERLSDAQRHAHPVLALVRGSALNQDGRSQGLTAPNGPAQEHVIRLALASAGLHASDVDAVEGHGTGTTLGDPIEARALLSAYGAERAGAQPLWLGSLKSNLGHTQAAAGVAGVIKMVLALQHGVLPRSLHAELPSRHVDWSSGAVKLLAEPVAWTAQGRTRRAGVSSFGISGTNAHVILEEAPADTDAASLPAATSGAVLLPISARSPAALENLLSAYERHLVANSSVSIADISYTACVRRTHHAHRRAVVGSSREELIERLASLRTNEAPVERGRGTPPSPLAFVFSGPGSQWQGMARGLLAREKVFRTEMERCDALLRRHAGSSPSCDHPRSPRPLSLRFNRASSRFWRPVAFGRVPCSDRARARYRPLSQPVRCRWIARYASSITAGG
jgi:acyl transferase domain-containing protein/acyl carrier protein